jgi:hypothetical protein
MDERRLRLAGRYSLRGIWEDLALPDLAYGFKLAIGPTKLAIMFLAVAAICLTGYLLDRCSRSVVVHPEPSVRPYGGAGTIALIQTTELEVYLVAPEQIHDFFERYRGQAPGRGVFSTLWSFAAGRFNDSSKQLFSLGRSSFFSNVNHVFVNLWLCLRAVVWAMRFHPWYSVFFFSFSFAVLCFAGGAVCRCAALEYAQNEKPGFFEAIEFAGKNYRSLVSASLLPWVLMLVPATLSLGIGALGTIPWVGELLIGVLFGFLILMGLAIIGLALGTTAGGLLLFPAVAYEGTTGRDAIGRAVSYVLNKPLWMLFYIFAAGLFGTFFYLLIRLIVFLTLKVVHGLLAGGMMTSSGGTEKLNRLWTGPALFSLMGQTTASANWSESIGSFLIYLFFLFIIGLLAAYVLSYVFCASTIVYALMRKKVDVIEAETVYIPLAYERTDATASREINPNGKKIKDAE